MKNIKASILSITLLIVGVTITSHSQTLQYKFAGSQNDNMKSPNYEVFNFKEVLSTEGASYTGDLSLTIPIMTIPGRNGHDFPLILNYNSNVTQRQKASWVGLGWSLDFGHVDRQVYGRPDDDAIGYGNNDRVSQNSRLMGNQPALNSENVDVVDSYSISMDGNSFEILPFPVDETGNPSNALFLPLSWKPLQITSTMSSRITSFDATKDDGTKYYFGKNPDIPNSNEFDEAKVTGMAGSQQTDYFVYRWNLAKILYTDGAFTTIKYTQANLDQHISRNYESVYMDRGNTYNYTNENSNFFGSPNSSASSYLGSVGFQYSIPCTVETETHYAVIETEQLTTADRYFKLKQIVLYSKIDGSEVKRVIFGYASVDNNNSGMNADWVSGQKLKDNQLTLLSITTQVGAVPAEDYSNVLPSYRFQYVKNPFIDIAQIVNNPAGDFPGFYTNEQDGMAVDAWKLKQIHYPSGLNVNYSYEPFNPAYDPQGNAFSSESLPQGFPWYPRARVKTKTIQDNVTGSKTFTYNYPGAHFDTPSHPLPMNYTVKWNGSNRDYNDSKRSIYFSGCSIGHEYVDVVFPDGTSKKRIYYSSSINSTYRDGFTAIMSQPNILITSRIGIRGLVLKEESYKNTNTLYSTITNTYNIKPLKSFLDRYTYGADFSGYQHNQTVQYQSLWPQLIKTEKLEDGVTSTTDYEYYKAFTESTIPGEHPANGQIKSKKEWNSLWYKLTTYVYACSVYQGMSDATMYSQPYSVSIHQGVDKKSEQLTEWNSTFTSSSGKWKPSLEKIWTDASNYTTIRSFNDYDNYGNLKQETDANGNVTKYYYGDNTNPLGSGTTLKNAFVTAIEKVISPSNLIAQFKYDFRGNITDQTDENNNTFRYEYDIFGRLKNTFGPTYPSQKLSDYSYTLAGDNYSLSYVNKINQKKYRDINSVNPITSDQYYDGLGLELQTQLYLGSDKIVTHKVYDSFGRISKEYKPYQQSANSFVSDANVLTNANSYYNSNVYFEGFQDSYPYSEYSYDEIGTRPVNIKYPGIEFRSNNHFTRFEYGSNTNNPSVEVPGYSANTLFKTTTYNENQIPKLSYSDIHGNVIQSIDDPNGLKYKTTFEYDANGNILKTTPPRGETNSLHATTYTYNAQNQLILKKTPDAGSVQYLYDKNGNLRLMKDSNHTGAANYVYENGVISVPSTTPGSFSLTMPGRVTISTGVYDMYSDEYIIVNIRRNNAIVATATSDYWYWTSSTFSLPKGDYTYEVTSYGYYGEFEYTIECSENLEFVYYKYDELNRVKEVGEYESSNIANFTQSNANYGPFPTNHYFVNRSFTYDVASTNPLAGSQRNLKGRLSSERSYTLGSLSLETIYSYDELGRVEYMIQDGLGWYAKKISYEYDLQGNVTRKIYEDYMSSTNMLYTWYDYDEIGRMLKVYTSVTGNPAGKHQEAAYTYFASGKVKRMQLENAQGVDYRYSERDWLKAINHQNLGGLYQGQPQDPGRDGYDSGLPVDKLGMIFGYNVPGHIGDPGYQNAVPQFNGNISWMIYNMSGVNTGGTSLVGYTFAYYNNNTFKDANFGIYTSSWVNWNPYDMMSMLYDSGGSNIKYLQRKTTSGMFSDKLTYEYYPNTNKLRRITDQINPSYFTYDIDTQPADNYTYDHNGNMLQSTGDNNSFIYYDIFNLPIRIYRSNGEIIYYSYDTKGNRIRKLRSGIDEYYVNGIDGKTELVTSLNSYTPLYNLNGNDMFGQIRRNYSTLTRYYYLKDQLGNIRMTVNSSGTPVSWDDYYPFGVTMDQRSGSGSADTRYKYTTKERDIETGYDYFGARYYDSRIGKWMSVDPLLEKYPELSPYNYAANNPISLYDPDGKGIKSFLSALLKATNITVSYGAQAQFELKVANVGVGVGVNFYSNNYVEGNFIEGFKSNGEQKSNGAEIDLAIFGAGTEKTLTPVKTDLNTFTQSNSVTESSHFTVLGVTFEKNVTETKTKNISSRKVESKKKTKSSPPAIELSVPLIGLKIEANMEIQKLIDAIKELDN
ncbi:MAG: RHS repeat-associated core domain-containing protein [Bacteroidota bacterium]